ncbi:MAG TPA: metalloregulator ArsR/SmtB family transcription factor [Propionibacteriaceae bacterium]|nr:metalloregulator ArsR/SmtB family transcription factor [Propionibacteriaceae bacterium]
MKTLPIIDACEQQAERVDEAAAAEDRGTRERVVRSILSHGPSTVAELSDRLGLTTAAIRRHLGVLCDTGLIASREQRVYGQRGRGRPAKVFLLTDAGRASFPQAYDRLASQAIDLLVETSGAQALASLAKQRTQEIESVYESLRGERPDADPVDLLAESLNRTGYVTSIEPIASGEQLCQHHCPIAHVAAKYPELCAAETELFSSLLHSHVQRLATIAHGDGVCTTHVPNPPAKG